MKPPEAGAPQNASADPAGSPAPIHAEPSPAAAFIPAVDGFVRKTLVIAELEIRKLRHDYSDLFLRSVQPILWLLLFGQVFTRTRAIPTGNLRYLDFMAPGILAQSVLFSAIFYGIAVIWERDVGIINKLLVSPTPRAALTLGKALSAGLRALPSASLIYILAAILGVHPKWDPLSLLGVAAALIAGAALFSTFSLIIACLVKTRERFMGIGQLMTMPLFFASNAIYPVSMMPGWMQAVSRANPLSYEVDALRELMLGVRAEGFGLGLDFAVLTAVTTVLVLVSAKLYPRVVI